MWTVFTFINPFSPGAQCNICHTFVQWSVTCDMSQWSVTVICHMNHRAYFCMTSVEPTHFDHVPILVLGLPGKPVCHSCVTTCIPQANQCASLVLLHVYPNFKPNDQTRPRVMCSWTSWQSGGRGHLKMLSEFV